MRSTSSVLAVEFVGAATAGRIPRNAARITCWLILMALLCMSATAEASSQPDFDRDGNADLAIGVPWQDINGAASAGAVRILHGTSAGLSAARTQLWHQDVAGVAGSASPWDLFGYTLAWGDFNGDGYADLAIGVPFKDIAIVSDAGAVNVLYGSPSGLGVFGNQIWYQGINGVADAAETGDRFGEVLGTGDFNGDGYSDLAVGVPFEDMVYTVPNVGAVTIADAGAVNVLYGSPAGLTSTGDQVWHQKSSGVPGDPETRDRFGSSLAAGDFDGDGRDDLAIGTPLEDIEWALYPDDDDAGAVYVLYGSYSGLSGSRARGYNQHGTDSEDRDYYGWSLAAGDFDGDGRDDLAIGIPGESGATGAVEVLGGSPDLLGYRHQKWFQGVGMGLRDAPEDGDFFGGSLAVGDFNDDGRHDLAVGVPQERLGSDPGVFRAGAVHVLYGSEDLLTSNGDQFWHQDVSGIKDLSELGDAFGGSVATGDFNGDGRDDLAIGTSREDVTILYRFQTLDLEDAGAVHVLYAGSVGLSPTGNQFWHGKLVPGGIQAGDYFGWSLARR